MFKWLSNRSLSAEDRVKIACAIYNRNDPSKLYLPKWLSEEIVSLHNTKPRPHATLAHLWRLLAACLQDGQQTLLNHLHLIHVARDEIACESCAVDDVVFCLRKFPDTLCRRYDVLIELLGPLIKFSINRIDVDHIHTPLVSLLLSLFKKFLYCQCNHGNQKKVFKQFCENLLWPCLQLRHLCVQLGTPGAELLVLLDKILANLFHKNHLVGYNSGLASLTASSSYTRHLFESLSAAVTDNDEVITSSLPHLFRMFLEHNRKANNAVKRNTEFQFFQWLLNQLGIIEGESGLDVVEGAKVPVIHKCLCVLQEFDVFDPSYDKSTGGSQLTWLEALAKALVDASSGLTQEIVDCLSVLLTIYHPIVEPLLSSLLCQLALLADNNFMMMLINVYAKLRRLKEFLYMQLESIKSSHELTQTALYSCPVAVHLADHLKHLPTGQVTAIIEMFLSHLHDNLPLEAFNDSIATNGFPRKKKRKLQNKDLMIYKTFDLFCLVLDHIPLVGIDVAKLIHQQLYHDTVLPLLTSLPSLQPCLVQCSLHLAVSCTRLLGNTQLLTNHMLSSVDVPSACQGLHKSVTDGASQLLLKQLVSLHVRFGVVEQDDLSDMPSFVLRTPAVHQCHWDGQWLNVGPANVAVANWKLIISELPHVCSLCSNCHLLGIADVIIDVFMLLRDQIKDDDDDDDNDGLHFANVTVDFLTLCSFQEMSQLHTLLLQCVFQKAKLASSKLPKSVRTTINTLCKMFSKFDAVKLSTQLTSVLSDNNDLDVQQLELWNKNILCVIEILRYLPVDRLSAEHLVMCIALILVWLFTIARCPIAHDKGLKYTLLLAWLLRAIKDHPQRKRYLVSFPFLAIQEWISSLLLDEENYNSVVWPVSKALLECAASCDPSVMSSVIAMCTQALPQHAIDSHAFNIITEIATTSLNTILKNVKLPLPEALQQEVCQFYHVIQKIIRKACKKKFNMLLSSPSLISLYVTATPVVPEDNVDDGVSSSLLEDVQDAVQAESITEIDEDELAVSKKAYQHYFAVSHLYYCSVIEVLSLALMRGHSSMAVWQTGLQLWEILLGNTSLSPDALPYSKLNTMMSKLVSGCSTEDAKIMFESLLSKETSSHLLFIKHWQLILTSKMSTDVRKILNHYTSQLICRCMEVLAVGSGSSEILHNSMSLVAKLLTMCTEHDSRSVMLTFHACLSPPQQQQCCLKWMGLCIAILSTVVRYHLNIAIFCAPILFAAIGKLVVGVIEVAQFKQADDILDEVVTVANNLCRVIELISAEVKFTKFVPHLIATYLLQVGGERGGEIPDIVKETLLSGIYLLLRLCTEHETSFLNATLDECSRELFKVILSEYHKLHKYKGKV